MGMNPEGVESALNDIRKLLAAWQRIDLSQGPPLPATSP
jgi:hypothetical protein